MARVMEETAAYQDERFLEAPSRASPGPAISPWLWVILLTVFLPEGMSFFIAGLRLTPTRLVFLILAPVVFARFVRKIASGDFRFVLSDAAVPLAGLWMFVGPSVTYDLGDALQHSGPDVLEYLIGYLATRVLLTRSGQALRFADILCVVIACVAADAMLDTAAGAYVTRELASTVTGYQKVWRVADEFRFGLLRAAGPIEHPILLGFLCGAGLILSIARRPAVGAPWMLLCAVGVLISFSSAPQQSVVMGLGLLVYSRLLPDFAQKWNLLFAVVAIDVAVAFAATPTPFGHIFDLFTIDSQTAYFRLYIWNMVGPAILDNPIFAVMPSDYDYEGSVDSLWLVLCLNYGMPCSILTGLAMIGCCSLPTDQRRSSLSPAESRLGTALGIMMFLIIFTGFTVHFWGSVWILVGLLIGLRAHLGELGRLREANREPGLDVAAATSMTFPFASTILPPPARSPKLALATSLNTSVREPDPSA